MKVEIMNLQSLFDGNMHYVIPPFQRRYVWDEEEQWDPLWVDVRNTAESVLEDGAFKTAHFLGAVVTQDLPWQKKIVGLQMSSVVDGQQRLTTMQLLLGAVREVFEERNHSDEAAMLRSLVLNQEMIRRNDHDRAFKVWPTIEDQDVFRHTMDTGLPSERYKDELIVKCHKFFKRRISYWLSDTSENTEEMRAKALQTVVFQLLEMVEIALGPDEEPQVIYETLNARGTPLLQSELIKNKLLYEASKITSDDSSISQLWGFDDNWWRRNVGRGRNARARIDVFLNYWLAMRKQEEVAQNNVFSNFESYFSKVGNSNAHSVAADLKDVGSSYERLEKSEIPEMKTFLHRRNAMQAGVSTPVLMWLVSSEVPKEQEQKAILALESYLVRRTACDMTMKDYNRLFLSLISELQAAGPEKAGDTIVEYLKRQQVHSRIWPDDHALSKAFNELDLFQRLTRPRLRILLEGIEEGLRTNKTEERSVIPGLTIEHIMPQGWDENWELPEVDDQTQARFDRDDLIHTIGNLTLVNRRLNPTLSNRAWEDKDGKEGKRNILRDHSTLFLNKEIVKEPQWNEERIKARAAALCEVAIKVWPHADGIA